MTRASNMTLWVLLLSVIVVAQAAAQWNVARFETGQSRVYSTFGLDPAMIGSVGYARVVELGDHKFQLNGDVGAATSGFDANDFRVRLGTQTTLLQWRSMHLTGSATFVTRGTDNSIYRGINFGADVTGALGVYRNRWFTAGEFGFDKAIITHISNSGWYKDNYYPDAKDGWYLDAGGTYHYGLAGGFTMGRTEIVGRVGLLRTERFKELSTPGYVSLGVGFGF